MTVVATGRRWLDAGILRALDARACLQAVGREGRRWESVEKDGPLRVFYGHDHVPRRDESASGGIVKCQDLETLFPNTPNGASLMYLVSSALPPAPHVVRRYARKAGVPIVLNQNGVAIPAYHGARCETINRPRRGLFLDADYVVYQSRFCEQTARQFLGERKGPGQVLYNPVDTSVFTPQGHALNGKVATLLLAGSHCHQYRVFSAVRALAEMRRRGMSVRLIIAGRLVWSSSPEAARAELIACCRECNVMDDVDIRGAYVQADAVDVMREGDILLHTKYMDPCPRLVVEAMACGVPVVYSDSGGVPELVGTDAGVGVTTPIAWDTIHEMPPDAAAEAVARVLDDYSTYSRAARARAADTLDVQPWLMRHRDLFEALHAG